ncbi:hypothetical protein J7L13_01435, partial [bacterium]|nr:hypothetical protein [bacterium]
MMVTFLDLVYMTESSIQGSGGTDTEIEHPENATPGWEVLSKGMVSGTAPRRAFETAVNNIQSFNSLYSLSYTGMIYLSNLTTSFSLDPKPFNTQGRRGFSTGSLNPYKADGLQLKRPNAAPVNEIDPLEEDISTWASEYVIWFVQYPISQGTVGEGNDGTLEFGCFLPLDFSGWPRYWGNKIYGAETDPVTRIVIGRPFVLTSGSYPGDYADPSTDVDPDLFALTPVPGIGSTYVPTDTSPSGYYYGVWRDNKVISGPNEYYKLPPFYIVKESGISSSYYYPYEDMVVDLGAPILNINDAAYYGIYGVSISSASNLPYISYFMGPLSLNYNYQPKAYSYNLGLDAGSDLSVDEKMVLNAYTTGGSFTNGNKFDISFALTHDLDTSSSPYGDLNGLSFANITNSTFNIDQVLGDDILSLGESYIHSARAVVYPNIVRELDDGSIDGSGAPSGLSDDGGAHTLTPNDGDVLIFKNRMFIYSGARFYPDPSEYTNDWASGFSITPASPALLIQQFTTCPTGPTIPYANVLHFAEIIAGESNNETPSATDYKFYENYGTQAIPVFEYSLDGSSWFELDPKYIAEMKWVYSGQKYPNDDTATNTFKITFIGTSLPGDYSDSGYPNDIWSNWLGLWDTESILDPTLSTKYSNLNTWFTTPSTVDDVGEMDDTTWAEFLAWAGDTVPPFMELAEGRKSLVIKPNAEFRLSAVTTKGHLTQVYSRSALDAANRSDYYFLSGDTMTFGAPPTSKLIVSYLTKIDYIPNVDYTVDSDGVITFTNPDKQPFGNTYSEYKRFLLGFDFQYLPEWFDLPANRSLHGGSSGIHMDTKTKYEELETVLEDIRDVPPEILVPVDYYVDET